MSETSSGNAAVSYAANVRPLFRDRDIQSMRKARNLDLSSYDDVSRRADDILSRLTAGDMPCDGAWPQSQIDLFAKWIAQGKAR